MEEELPQDAPGEEPETLDVGTPDDEQPSGTESAEPEQAPSGVQKRIDQLTRDKYELKGQLDAMQRQLATLQQPPPAPEAEPEVKRPVRPKLDDYDGDYAQYSEALAQYTDDVVAFNKEAARREFAQEQEAQRREAAENQRREARVQTWQERANEFKERHADFDVVVTNPALPITAGMFEAMQGADNGPEVAYHLGKNPEVAMRIASMDAGMQAIEIGKLSGRLEAKASSTEPAGNKVTGAPPPAQPVKATGASPEKDPSKMSLAEYSAYREAGGGR